MQSSHLAMKIAGPVKPCWRFNKVCLAEKARNWAIGGAGCEGWTGALWDGVACVGAVPERGMVAVGESVRVRHNGCFRHSGIGERPGNWRRNSMRLRLAK